MLSAEKAKIFSQRLAGRRASLGLSQSDLAEKAGVSLRSVQNWESGDQFPTGKKLHNICAALNTDISYFYRPDDPSPLREEGVPYEVVDHPSEQACLDYLRRFLTTCRKNTSRLGWTLVELKSKFPMNKWEEEDKALPEKIAGTSLSSTTPAARAVHGIVPSSFHQAAKAPSQSPATGETTEQKAGPTPDADKD